MNRNSEGKKRLSPLWRGELVSLYKRAQKQGLENGAIFCGFQSAEVQKERPQEKNLHLSFNGQSVHADKSTLQKKQAGASPPVAGELVCCHLTSYRPEKKDSSPPSEAQAEFLPLTDDAYLADMRTFSVLPLAPWNHIWPGIKNALAEERDTRHLDVDRALAIITKAEGLRSIPYKKKQGWASGGRVLLDRSCPFVMEDQAYIQQKIGDIAGRFEMEVWACPKLGPRGNWLHLPGGEEEPYRHPAPGTPVLLIGDLGYLSGDENLQRLWHTFGADMRARGLAPACLIPLTGINKASPWKLIPWERKEEDALEILLTLFSLPIRTELALLREARLRLTSGGVAAEAALCKHPEIQSTSWGITCSLNLREQYRSKCKLLAKKVRETFLGLLKKYHGSSAPMLYLLELGAYRTLTGDPLPDGELDEFTARLARTLESKELSLCRAATQWIKHLIPLLPAKFWSENRYSGAIWVLTHVQELKEGKLADLPPGLDLNDYSWLLEELKNRRDYCLKMAGRSLLIEQERSDNKPAPVFAFQADGPVSLESGPWQIPSGSTRAGYGARGAKMKILASGSCIPLEEKMLIHHPAFKATISTLKTPPWASALGRDRFSLWAEFTLQGLTQRLRWINPGEFLRGSPEEEPERRDDEKQHRVVLTEGFWLAETACTQELWEAVMGENPSRFKGAKRPVEQVSWDDCKKFFMRLNAQLSGLEFRLPTEAWWEYACRAGTTTPFSFGENITPAQVNYDGNHPYHKGAQGAFRKETVDVKSLPPNPWGLYEMHGNVWEWCEDRYGDYPQEDVTDPTGPETGGDRVCRGGCWNFDGRLCRCAVRSRFTPGFRTRRRGFRLSARSPEVGPAGSRPKAGEDPEGWRGGPAGGTAEQ